MKFLKISLVAVALLTIPNLLFLIAPQILFSSSGKYVINFYDSLANQNIEGSLTPLKTWLDMDSDGRPDLLTPSCICVTTPQPHLNSSLVPNEPFGRYKHQYDECHTVTYAVDKTQCTIYRVRSTPSNFIITHQLDHQPRYLLVNEKELTTLSFSNGLVHIDRQATVKTPLKWLVLLEKITTFYMYPIYLGLMLWLVLTVLTLGVVIPFIPIIAIIYGGWYLFRKWKRGS